MLLQIDELISMSPVNTVCVSGCNLSLDDILKRIRQAGAFETFRELSTPFERAWLIPPISPPTTEANMVAPPSVTRARTLFPQMRVAHPGVLSDNLGPRAGFWVSPRFAPVHGHTLLGSFSAFTVMIIPPTGPLVISIIDIQHFTAMSEKPGPIADSKRNFQFEGELDRTAANYALRMMTVSIAGDADAGPLTAIARGLSSYYLTHTLGVGMSGTTLPKGWTLNAVLCFKFPTTSIPLSLEDNDRNKPYPSPPIARLGVYVDNTILTLSHSTIDFAAEEKLFEESEKIKSVLADFGVVMAQVMLTIMGFFTGPADSAFLWYFQSLLPQFPSTQRSDASGNPHEPVA